MRVLRYIVLAIIFLIALIAIIGLFLPAKVVVERSIVINKSPEAVFQAVNSLDNFNTWSPWFEFDPDASFTIGETVSGVGSIISWEGNEKVYNGSFEIVESKPYSHIKTKFYFGKPDHPVFTTFSFEKNGSGTKTTWAFENDFGYNVFYRYFGFILDKTIAPSSEKGLSKLKLYLEKN